MRKRFAVLALAVALAACGGDAEPPRAQTGTPSVTRSGAQSFSPGGATATVTPDRHPSASTHATASSTGGAEPGRRVTAAIDRACVRRGVDTQGLTVNNARPRGYAGYSTEYSDHSNEVSNPSYTTGYGYGVVDANGRYRATWVVPASAPAGIATLRVIYSASEQPIVLTFDVVAQSGAC